jgi:hypothetical protein
MASALVSSRTASIWSMSANRTGMSQLPESVGMVGHSDPRQSDRPSAVHERSRLPAIIGGYVLSLTIYYPVSALRNNAGSIAPTALTADTLE